MKWCETSYVNIKQVHFHCKIVFCEIFYRICAEFHVFSYPAENRYTAENWYSYPIFTVLGTVY